MVKAAITLIKRLFAIVSDANLDLIAAGVAFYAMLAIFPAVAAVVALWGFVSDPALVDEQLEALSQVMPPEAFVLLDSQVERLISTSSSTLGWASLVSIAAAIWSTRAGVGALVRGLNAVYGLTPRSGLWHSIAALLMTFVLVGLALAALVAVVVVPLVLALLPLGVVTTWALIVARWGLQVGVGLAGLWLIYRYGPNHGMEQPVHSAAGAALALILWVGASWGFSTYLSEFGAYGEFYGSIGAVVILLMWFFITAYAVLLGAALNRALERR